MLGTQLLMKIVDSTILASKIQRGNNLLILCRDCIEDETAIERRYPSEMMLSRYALCARALTGLKR